jgi:hypothetical protein
MDKKGNGLTKDKEGAVVDELKRWWQSNLVTTALILLSAIIGVLLSGLWMDIADMKRNLAENHKEMATIR